MLLVFFSTILNNHQVNVADELWKLTDHQYRFVELANLSGDDKKGDTRNYNDCPYLIKAWESTEAYNKAMKLATTADCCVFSGVQALPLLKERLKRGLLSFDMSERWLKKGFINLISPAIIKMFLSYHFYGWKNKPLYKLCCSAYAASDQHRLGTFINKCYKWGYFTKVENYKLEASSDVSSLSITPLMWCSRYLSLKHPEIPILLAEQLKNKGHKFVLNMYGEGQLKGKAIRLVEKLKLNDVVHFYNNIPNEVLLTEMRKHEIFLFTSDQNEGWGAVANESMSNGCVLVASEKIGCVPYLINNDRNGLIFKSPSTLSNFNHPDYSSLESLCEKVEWLLEHVNQRKQMQVEARETMQQVWSPNVTAKRLLTLIDSIKNGQDTPFENGPCSKA